MDIIRLNAKALVELFKIFLLFILVAAARIIVTLFWRLDLIFFALGPIDEVKFVHFAGAKQGEVVLTALVVDTVELGYAAVCRDDMSVPKQAPHLTQGQREGLLTLGRLDLLSVQLVPVLEISVVAKKDVLALFFNLCWVRLKVNQVLDIDELSEWVLLDLLLGHVGGTSLGRFGWVLVSGLFLVLLLGRCGIVHFRLGNVALDHAILFKWTIVLCAVLEGENAMAMLEVLIPVTLVLTAVRVIESALAMSQAVFPVAHVAIAEQFVVRAGVKPDVRSETALQVVLPVARVSLIARQPVHLTVAVSLIVLPVALVVVLRCVDHLTLAPFHAALPETRVHRSILVTKLAMSVSHSVLPMAIVFYAFALIYVLAFAVAQSIENVSFVGALVRPGICTLSSDLVLLELTTVDGAIGPLKDTTAPEKTKTQFTLVLVSIFELACTVTVIHFADL